MADRGLGSRQSLGQRAAEGHKATAATMAVMLSRYAPAMFFSASHPSCVTIKTREFRYPPSKTREDYKRGRSNTATSFPLARLPSQAALVLRG